MTSSLPERASLDYLRKLAKDRLRQLRQADSRAKLATALLTVAREHGFSSWRALKAEVEARRAKSVALFFAACAKGEVEALRGQLAQDPDLVRAGNPDRRHLGWTGLHAAAERGHVDAVRLLLAHGADPNAREAGDNAYALHFAAGYGQLAAVRALLDAGADVHGIGDLHEAEVIGWATALSSPSDVRWDVLSLLLERGARHHIFSAIAVGDPDLIQRLVEHNPEVLDRRMSRFEQGQTPLHFAISRDCTDILDLLIGLGADLEAEDGNGRTALAAAMQRNHQAAMRLLHAAGAKQPASVDSSGFRAGMSDMAGSVRKGVPMLSVPDIGATVDWYVSIGFKELGRYEEGGLVNWGMVSFGHAELMLRLGERPRPHEVSLWLYTDRVDDLYRLLRSRQLEAAQAALAGERSGHGGIEFVEDLYEPFYGGRQFSIRDPNGYTLIFLQTARQRQAPGAANAYNALQRRKES
jgi:ankyrin repeat protein/catechol 2,3-dioxygenase-like lactoylglutathione lyase family enzyme